MNARLANPTLLCAFAVASTSVAATSAPGFAQRATVTVSGQIVDFETKAPLRGATVYVSRSIVTGGTPPQTPTADAGQSVSAATGEFEVAIPSPGPYPATYFLEVFGPGTATVHRRVVLAAAGATILMPIGLTTLSKDESQWVALINRDRDNWNRPPLAVDEFAEEWARIWARYLSAGHFGKACASDDPSCPSQRAFYAAAGAQYAATSENTAAGPQSFAQVESLFIGEARRCPLPVDPSTCPFAAATGHFFNLLNADALWTGVAETLNAPLSFKNTSFSTYFVQEFGYPNDSAI